MSSVSNQNSQLLKGVLGMLLLQLLHDDEDYGYSVVVRLHKIGFTDLAEGTVYPALSRLENKGFVESRLVASESGPARKYYKPTPAGKEELEIAKENWKQLQATVGLVVA